MNLYIELRLILVVLATWRVAHLLSAEDGPADVIIRLRTRLGDSLFGRALDCFYCISLWIAAPFALFVTQDLLTWFFVWLAVSAAACLLERVTSSNLTPHPFIATGASHELLWTETTGSTNTNDTFNTNSETTATNSRESDPTNTLC